MIKYFSDISGVELTGKRLGPIEIDPKFNSIYKDVKMVARGEIPEEHKYKPFDIVSYYKSLQKYDS